MSVHPVLHVLVIWVEVVDDGVCIGLVAGSEHNYLEVLVCLSQTLVHVGSDVDSSVYRLVFIFEVYLYYDVWVFCFNVIYTVDESFIQIKDNGLLFVWLIGLREINLLEIYYFLINRLEISFDKLQSLDSLNEVNFMNI